MTYDIVILVPFLCLHSQKNWNSNIHSPLIPMRRDFDFPRMIVVPSIKSSKNEKQPRSKAQLAFRMATMRRGLAPRTKGIEHTFGLFKETARRGFEYAEEAWWSHPFRTTAWPTHTFAEHVWAIRTRNLFIRASRYRESPDQEFTVEPGAWPGPMATRYPSPCYADKLRPEPLLPRPIPQWLNFEKCDPISTQIAINGSSPDKCIFRSMRQCFSPSPPLPNRNPPETPFAIYSFRYEGGGRRWLVSLYDAIFRFHIFDSCFFWRISVEEKEKGKTEITFFFGNVLEKFEKRGENGIEMCPIGLTSVNVIFSKLEVSSLFITRRDVLFNFWPRIYEVRNWELRRSGRECVVKWCKAFRLFILDKLYNW